VHAESRKLMDGKRWKAKLIFQQSGYCWRDCSSDRIASRSLYMRSLKADTLRTILAWLQGTVETAAAVVSPAVSGLSPTAWPVHQSDDTTVLPNNCVRAGNSSVYRLGPPVRLAAPVSVVCLYSILILPFHVREQRYVILQLIR